MSKTLAIIGYSQQTADMFARQINSLFSGMLGVKEYCLENELPFAEIQADIILAESFDAYNRLKDRIHPLSEIVFAKRTISKNGYNLIMGLPVGADAWLLDENMEMAEEMIAVLYQIGIRHLKLSPASRVQGGYADGKTVIVLRDTEKAVGPVCPIGSSLLDVSTIIDIGVRADLDYILNKQNIIKSYKEIMTVNVGLAEILAKTNKFEGSLDILLGMFDQGVIAINADGQVFACNQKAKTIMGHENAIVIGENGIALFPQIPFERVLENGAFVSEKLEKIGGYDVIISVNAIVHSGRELGAVAIVKRFSEEERKQHSIRLQLIGKGHKAKYVFDDILGESEAIQKCRTAALNMAKSDSSILITGESGTGKEMFAQSIHNSSKRKEFQFVAVNCGALPESLLESELFGYEEGAFTGAKRGGKPGLFELAHKGTLFLDEIEEMPLKLQRSLLRVLQEREVMRLGGDRLISVDIRLIAATNRDLKGLLSDGRFREDLYYRLNVLPLFVPPLRARKEDISSLISGFKKSFNWEFSLSASAGKAIFDYSWPGNIRQLRNCIEYISNLEIKTADIGDLPFEAEGSPRETVPAAYREEYSDETKQLAGDLVKTAGRSLWKYHFLLQELNAAFLKNKRSGRRSLSIAAKEQGLFLGEQEIRVLSLDLERHKLVDIYPGRGGTVITEAGRNVLAFLDQNQIQE